MSKLVCRPLSALALAAAVAGVSAPARADEVEDLTKAAADYAAGKYAPAALQFFEIAEGATNPEVQYRAESFLAQSLFKLGLYHSALYYDKTIIEMGPAHPYYVQAVENTLDVMDAVGDKAIIPSLLDQEYNENFAKLPKQMIDRVNFIVAFWGHQQKRVQESVDFLDAVKSDSAHYPRARYLRAVQFAQEATSGDAEQNEEAAKLFLEVLKLKNAGDVKYADLQELQDLSTLGLARVRYAQQKFSESYELYSKVPRFSRLWRDALFEGAYAAMQNEEYGKALGFLHTLHAPVAGDQFIPESWLLKAHIYYFTCLFDEAKAALTRLQQDYPKTAEEVKALVDAKLDPDAYYELLIKGSSGDQKMPVNVRNELLKDEGLRGRRSYVGALAEEEQKLASIPEFRGKLLQEALLEAVRAQRVSLVQAAGKGVRLALARIQYTLEDMDGQADIVRFEMAKREKDLFESNHDSEAVLAGQALNRPSMPTHGIEYWDFEGEFWPDELGYYRFTLKNACPVEERTIVTADSQ